MRNLVGRPGRPAICARSDLVVALLCPGWCRRAPISRTRPSIVLCSSGHHASVSNRKRGSTPRRLDPCNQKCRRRNTRKCRCRSDPTDNSRNRRRSCSHRPGGTPRRRGRRRRNSAPCCRTARPSKSRRTLRPETRQRRPTIVHSARTELWESRGANATSDCELVPPLSHRVPHARA